MVEVSIEYPFSASDVRDLKIGDNISLSGIVYTGRDRLHKHLFDGGKSPVDLNDSALYHCGPVVVYRDGVWHVQAAGPTTSVREEPYMARIIEQHHVRVIIGKGGMGDATTKACAKHGCVYLQTVGGAASVMAQTIERVESVHLMKEFGAVDAVWEFVVRDLKAVVAIDAHNHNIHKRVRASSKRALKTLLAG